MPSSCVEHSSLFNWLAYFFYPKDLHQTRGAVALVVPSWPEFPRRTLLGSSLNKVRYRTPRYRRATRGGPPRIICLCVSCVRTHRLWVGYAHDGYRGCGRRDGLVVGGAG